VPNRTTLHLCYPIVPYPTRSLTTHSLPSATWPTSPRFTVRFGLTQSNLAAVDFHKTPFFSHLPSFLLSLALSLSRLPVSRNTLPCGQNSPVDENGHKPESPLYYPFIDQIPLPRGPPPKHMAITKWISFGAGQHNPASPTSTAQGGNPLAVAVSSADTKEFGLENVRAMILP